MIHILKGAFLLQQLKFIPFLFIIGALLLAACSAEDESPKTSNDNEQKETNVNQKENIEKDSGNQNKADSVNENNQETNAAGTKVVDNPTDPLVLVNKQHALPDGYIPPDLEFPEVRFPFTEDVPKKQMRK